MGTESKTRREQGSKTEITSRIQTYGNRKTYGNALEEFIAIWGNFGMFKDTKLGFIPIESSSVSGRVGICVTWTIFLYQSHLARRNINVFIIGSAGATN